MKKYNLLLATVLLISYTSAQSKDEIVIRNILNEQAIAWSIGSIENFMQPYWHNDSLMFIGRSGVTYGWQKALENYKKNYPDVVAMGKLDYTIFQIKRLPVLYYFVVGKWHLTRTIGDLNGYFTLLFKKINNTWVIISDHSS